MRDFKIVNITQGSDGKDVYPKTLSSAVTYNGTKSSLQNLNNFLDNLSLASLSKDVSINEIYVKLKDLDSSVETLKNTKQNNIEDYVAFFLSGTDQNNGITRVVQGANYNFLKLQYTTNKVKGGGQNILGVGDGLSLELKYSNGNYFPLLTNEITLKECETEYDDITSVLDKDTTNEN